MSLPFWVERRGSLNSWWGTDRVQGRAAYFQIPGSYPLEVALSTSSQLPPPGEWGTEVGIAPKSEVINRKSILELMPFFFYRIEKALGLWIEWSRPDQA